MNQCHFDHTIEDCPEVNNQGYVSPRALASRDDNNNDIIVPAYLIALCKEHYRQEWNIRYPDTLCQI